MLAMTAIKNPRLIKPDGLNLIFIAKIKVRKKWAIMSRLVSNVEE